LIIVFSLTLILIPLAIVLGVLIFVIGIFNLIMIIIAALKVSNGNSFQYPLTIQFLK